MIRTPISPSATARTLALIAALALALTGRASAADEPWRAPEEERGRANPVPATPASITAGRSLYMLHCQGCHGPQGRGDGPASRHIDMAPGDLTRHAVDRSTPDGELRWKIATGRGQMSPYSPHLSDNELWSLVNYIREIDKTPAEGGSVILQAERGGERLIWGPPPPRPSRRFVWLMLFGSIYFTGALVSLIMDRAPLSPS